MSAVTEAFLNQRVLPVEDAVQKVNAELKGLKDKLAESDAKAESIMASMLTREGEMISAMERLSQMEFAVLALEKDRKEYAGTYEDGGRRSRGGDPWQSRL